MTVGELLKSAEKRMAGAGLDSAQFESRQLAAHFLETEPSRLLLIKNEPVPKAVESRLGLALEKRESGYPLQYIIGSWEFYGLPFYVGEGVLIPRQDTELLVELALEFIKKNEVKTVVDLCSGSGCIAVSVGKNAPGVKVTAVEKFDAACEFTLRNIERNGADNVTAMQADLLEGPGKIRTDLLLSNPPYISREDMVSLPEDVKREPHTALYGGDDGLFFYREIAEKWIPAVNPGGAVFAEIGYDQGAAVAGIFKAVGLCDVKVYPDLNGCDRVVSGRKNK